MEYTDQLANELIARHNLRAYIKYKWKKLKNIPDKYDYPAYTAELTDAQRGYQQQILRLIQHPMLVHLAFSDNLSFKYKINNVITLRNGRRQGRKTTDNKPVPNLSLSRRELTGITNQLTDLANAISESLSRIRKMGFENQQAALRDLIKGRKELILRMHEETWPDEAARTRWKNFATGARGPLDEQDKPMIQKLIHDLSDLKDEIKLTTLFYHNTLGK